MDASQGLNQANQGFFGRLWTSLDVNVVGPPGFEPGTKGL